MNELIRPDLANLMIQAAMSMHEFGHREVAKGGYFPRVGEVCYKENKHGWPSVARSYLSSENTTELVKWTSVFGATKSATLKFDMNDVPELSPLIDLAISDSSLDQIFDPLGVSRHENFERPQAVAGGAVQETARLLMRAEAVGSISEDGLRTIYQQWERGHLENEVTGDLLFPILLTRFDLDARFEIMPGVSIEKMSEETHRMRALSLDSSEVNPFLAAAATHALVLHNQKFDNSGGDLVRNIRLSSELPGRGAADQFFQALTIASGDECGYAQICLRPYGWATDWKGGLPPLELIGTLNAYPRSFNGGWNTDGVTIDGKALTELPTLFTQLRETIPRAQLAARRLRQTSMRENRDDIVIDACIGIEALVGEERDELVHRMGLRASVALSKAGWDARSAYEVLKRVYSHRSKIVHGAELKNATIKIRDKDYEVGSVAVYLLRALLKAHLMDPYPWKPADLDDSLFKALNAIPERDSGN